MSRWAISLFALRIWINDGIVKLGFPDNIFPGSFRNVRKFNLFGCNVFNDSSFSRTRNSTLRLIIEWPRKWPWTLKFLIGLSMMFQKKKFPIGNDRFSFRSSLHSVRHIAYTLSFPLHFPFVYLRHVISHIQETEYAWDPIKNHPQKICKDAFFLVRPILKQYILHFLEWKLEEF